MSLFVDNRERELIPMLNGIGGIVKQLPVGDIWIGGAENGEGGDITVHGEGCVVIERKSIRDLEASILDGRYREQRTRLVTFCQERGARAMYLIEGSYYSTTGRIGPRGLMKIVASLQLRHQICVMHTQNIGETAELVTALWEEYTKDPKQLSINTTPLRAVETVHIHKKANSEDPHQFLTSIFALCPGISIAAAEKIANKFGCLENALAADEKDIATIMISAKRKLGPAIAKRLWTLLHFAAGSCADSGDMQAATDE
jgi:ERCC4-type nuclease